MISFTIFLLFFSFGRCFILITETLSVDAERRCRLAGDYWRIESVRRWLADLVSLSAISNTITMLIGLIL